MVQCGSLDSHNLGGTFKKIVRSEMQTQFRQWHRQRKCRLIENQKNMQLHGQPQLALHC